MRVSSLTLTVVAAADRDSAVEILIPSVRQDLSAPLDNGLDQVDLFAGKPSTPLKPNGDEPEFRFAIVTFDMDVRRFISVTRIEEETTRSVSENGRHDFMIRPVTPSRTSRSGVLTRK